MVVSLAISLRSNMIHSSRRLVAHDQLPSIVSNKVLVNLWIFIRLPVVGIPKHNTKRGWVYVTNPLLRYSLYAVYFLQGETMKVIEECNNHWKNLVDGKTEAGKMWIKK